jgi:glutamate-1-semialdehyde 2,1-aminomutase
MLRRGVALAPGPYEVMFPGLAHGDDVLERVTEAAGAAAAEVAKELSASLG